jgi:hypothetical protein
MSPANARIGESTHGGRSTTGARSQAAERNRAGIVEDSRAVRRLAIILGRHAQATIVFDACS